MNVRQIVLDTETTGLDPQQGHRIIEIGCVELVNRRCTERNFHHYLNPDREIDEGAFAVHGISNDTLRDKPRFTDISRDFLEYVKGAELIIHNAAFDIGFLDHELALADPSLGRMSDYCSVTDTLLLARQIHPGQRNDLDALCRRYEVDNTQRTLHGALLDAEILADVYRAMTGGQTTLFLENIDSQPRANTASATNSRRAGTLVVVRASAEELAEHQRWLDRLEQSEAGCLWNLIANANEPPAGRAAEPSRR